MRIVSVVPPSPWLLVNEVKVNRIRLSFHSSIKTKNNYNVDRKLRNVCHRIVKYQMTVERSWKLRHCIEIRSY